MNNEIDKCVAKTNEQLDKLLETETNNFMNTAFKSWEKKQRKLEGTTDTMIDFTRQVFESCFQAGFTSAMTKMQDIEHIINSNCPQDFKYEC